MEDAGGDSRSYRQSCSQPTAPVARLPLTQAAVPSIVPEKEEGDAHPGKDGASGPSGGGAGPRVTGDRRSVPAFAGLHKHPDQQQQPDSPVRDPWTSSECSQPTEPPLDAGEQAPPGVSHR